LDLSLKFLAHLPPTTLFNPTYAIHHLYRNIANFTAATDIFIVVNLCQIFGKPEPDFKV